MMGPVQLTPVDPPPPPPVSSSSQPTLVHPNTIKLYDTQRVSKTAARLCSVYWLSFEAKGDTFADILAIGDSAAEFYRWIPSNNSIKFVKAVKATILHFIYAHPLLVLVDNKAVCHALLIEHKGVAKSSKVEFKPFIKDNPQFESQIFLNIV
jgi:hypothetical protein